MKKNFQLNLPFFCTFCCIKRNIAAEFWSMLPEVIIGYEVCNFELHTLFQVTKSPKSQ